MDTRMTMARLPWNVCPVLTLLTILLASCGESGESVSDSSPESPPIKNLLFLMGDDHSAEVFRAYGNEQAETPNLDRLASEGIRFDRAYVNSPFCTPSRQSLITGRYPHAVGVTLLRTPLPESEVTIADHLGDLGFATGAVGKMHFNSDLHHGFDYRVDRTEYREHLEQNPPRPVPSGLETRPSWRPFQDPARIWLNADVLPERRYEGDAESVFFVEKAAQFLEENRDERFCLWLSFREPHSPFNFPIEYAGRYKASEMPLPEVGPHDSRWIPEVFRDLSESDKRGSVAAYYTSVTYLDSNIGRILEELDRLGLRENTLVIYVGDHGYLLGHHDRFEKHTMWEPVVRTPLVMRLPDGVRGTEDALVEFVDLVPTILDLLDVEPLSAVQGKSIVGLLTGEVERVHQYVFSEMMPDNMAMIRDERFKYVFYAGKHDLAMGYATGHPPAGITHFLYDTQNDPQEFRNLADEPEFQTRLDAMKSEMRDLFLRTDPRAPHLPPELTVDEQLAWFCEPPEGLD